MPIHLATTAAVPNCLYQGVAHHSVTWTCDSGWVRVAVQKLAGRRPSQRPVFVELVAVVQYDIANSMTK